MQAKPYHKQLKKKMDHVIQSNTNRSSQVSFVMPGIATARTLPSSSRPVISKCASRLVRNSWLGKPVLVLRNTNKGQNLSRTVRCCTEVPAWKKMPIDIDFAKDEQLEILEEAMDTALAEEDFSRAAELHKKLIRLQSGSYVAVLSMNMKFYKALNDKSIVDMAGCWFQSSSSSCKFPGGPLLTNYIDIINSFGLLFTYQLPHIQIRNCNIQMRGTVGYVTCDEVFFDEDGQQMMSCATNIYIKHNSQWYLIHSSSLFVES